MSLSKHPGFSHVTVTKWMFCPSSTCPPCGFSLSQLGATPPPKPDSKRQFSNLRSWHKPNLLFSPPLSLFQSLFLEILLISFLSLPPPYFIFSLVSLSLTIVPGCYPAGLSSFSWYKHRTQKNTKKTGNAIIKLSLPPRHRYFRQQPPFQHSWKGGKKKELKPFWAMSLFIVDEMSCRKL